MTSSIFERISSALAAVALPTAGSPANRAAPEPCVTGEGSLASCFDVTGLAVASIAAAGSEIARLAALEEVGGGEGGDARLRVEVDRRLASFWFGFSIRPVGWSLPSPWDPIAGDYRTRDGWIRLHTNAPRHRSAALSVLGVAAEKQAVENAVAGLSGEALEAAIVEAGGCAAQMRSGSDWSGHPQGRTVRGEPLIAWQTRPNAVPRKARFAHSSGRPLAGLRVLDLTRVLAGPVATRLLAAYGADVLRIDPPGWDEPGVVPEVTVGKRCAGLDLAVAADRVRFEELLAEADVLIQGYRPGALSGLGYDEQAIRALNPGLVDVALCAYGWTGPWRARRGFDSLIQMSSGIAEAGQRWAGAERPTPLPVQALDHATGYLMAAAAIRGVALRQEQGLVATARLSLARTAWLLVEAAAGKPERPLAAETAGDRTSEIEQTDWGPAQRLRFPLAIAAGEPSFACPACALRSGPARFRSVEK